ncbi:MAG: class I SAM-dependent methyltransferase [Paracoccaceae bacterium]
MFKWARKTPEKFSAPPTPDALIRASETRFPMPPGEMGRLEARRWILNMVAPGSTGIEIGVFRGHFSGLICEVARPRKLYLVDPWTKLGETFGWGKAYTNFDTLTTEAAKTEAIARVSRFPAVDAVFIEDTFPACAAQITGPLDFAYLDASHKYGPTLNELMHLKDMMAPGGLILGDDWAPDPQNQHHGVFLAVQDFTRNSGWDIVAAGPGAQWALRRRADPPAPPHKHSFCGQNG